MHCAVRSLAGYNLRVFIEERFCVRSAYLFYLVDENISFHDDPAMQAYLESATSLAQVPAPDVRRTYMS